MSETATIPVEHLLRDELAHGDVVISTTGPVLRHLLANDDRSLFSDEIVARVRGMVSDLARQMLFELAAVAGEDDRIAFVEDSRPQLAAALMEAPALLAHVHALALEHQLAIRLSQRNMIDPVLSSMMQELLASPMADNAALAMAVLAAQSRFMQYLRRMELPLGELPADLFHTALLAFRQVTDSDAAEDAEASLRNAFDESCSRIGLMEKLVFSLGGDVQKALSLSHAGLALFVSALASASGQDRDIVVLSLNERQLARLAVTLRASGLGQEALEEQFLHFHPDNGLPEGFETLQADTAASMLAEFTPLVAD